MKTKFLNYIYILVLVTVMVGCKSTETKTPPTFQENETFTLNGGDTQQVTFKASHSWRATVDQPWLRFVVDGIEKEVVAGDSGDKNFEVIIKEAGVEFVDQTATITMTMEGHKQVVYTITRRGIAQVAKFNLRRVTDGEIEEVESIAVPYQRVGTSAYFAAIKANFKWKLISKPSWLNVNFETSGMPNQAGALASMSILSDDQPFAQSGEVVIENVVDGSHHSLPINYLGMDDDVIAYTPDAGINTSYWTFDHFKASVNNDEWDVNTSATSPSNTFTVTSRDFKFYVYFVECNADTGIVREISPSENWVNYTINDAEHRVTYTVSENNPNHTERSLYMYVLPSKYATEKYNYQGDFVDGKYTPADKKRFAAAIIQEAKPTCDLVIKTRDGNSQQMIALLADPVRITDPALITQYGTTNLYRKVFTEAEWAKDKMFLVYINGIYDTDGKYNFTATCPTSEQWGGMFMIHGKKIYFGSLKDYADLPNETSVLTIRRAGDNSIAAVLLFSKQ